VRRFDVLGHLGLFKRPVISASDRVGSDPPDQKSALVRKPTSNNYDHQRGAKSSTAEMNALLQSRFSFSPNSRQA